MSPIRCSTKRTEPVLANRVEKVSDVGVKNEANLPAGDADHERVQAIVLAALRPEPVAEPEELFLVDAVQHRHGRPLDNLVLECRDRQRALSPIGLRYVRPA